MLTDTVAHVAKFEVKNRIYLQSKNTNKGD